MMEEKMKIYDTMVSIVCRKWELFIDKKLEEGESYEEMYRSLNAWTRLVVILGMIIVFMSIVIMMVTGILGFLGKVSRFEAYIQFILCIFYSFIFVFTLKYVDDVKRLTEVYIEKMVEKRI